MVEKNYKIILSPFKILFSHFRAANKELYAVGGCVRDILIGQTPKDFDFTTNATPSQIKEILRENGMKVIAIGENFGTIATLIAGKSYEITTYRVKESYKKDSRHPVVVFGTDLSKDLERRDLTINAMAMSEDGEIVDPFGGRQDLLARRLRVPRSSLEKSIEIFNDDPLRILRLARFLGRLGFEVDADAAAAAKVCAPQILHVSRERWKCELEGLLCSKNSAKGLQWLIQCGILSFMIPEFWALKSAKLHMKSIFFDTCDSQNASPLLENLLNSIDKIPNYSSIRWAWLFMLLGAPIAVRPDNAAGLCSLSQRMAGEIAQRLKFSNIERFELCDILHPFPSDTQDPSPSAARRLAIKLGAALPTWLELQRAKLRTLTSEAQSGERQRLEAWEKFLVPYIDKPEKAVVTLPHGLGQALQAQLRIQGKSLGLVLSALHDAVIDGALHEYDSLERYINYVRENALIGS
ncbi:MAG: CCA tRNA nucleotidyltransferase [Bradymonadales bacterium]|jgi:poly(A) polymerase